YVVWVVVCLFVFSSRRRHTRLVSDWSSDVCSSDLAPAQTLEQFVDGTGSGDAFCAGFLVPWLDKKPPLEALMNGCRLAARARSEIGRASCRERVEVSGGAAPLKKKKTRAVSRAATM